MQTYKHNTKKLCLATALTVLFAIIPVKTDASLSVGLGISALLTKIGPSFNKGGTVKPYATSKEAAAYLYNTTNPGKDDAYVNDESKAELVSGTKDDNHALKAGNVKGEKFDSATYSKEQIAYYNAANAYNVLVGAADKWKNSKDELSIANLISTDSIGADDSYDLDFMRRLSLQIYSKYVVEFTNNMGAGGYIQLGWNFTEMKFKDALAEYRYNEGFFGSIGFVLRAFDRLDLMIGLGVRSDTMTWTPSQTTLDSVNKVKADAQASSQIGPWVANSVNAAAKAVAATPNGATLGTVNGMAVDVIAGTGAAPSSTGGTPSAGTTSTVTIGSNVFQLNHAGAAAALAAAQAQLTAELENVKAAAAAGRQIAGSNEILARVKAAILNITNLAPTVPGAPAVPAVAGAYDQAAAQGLLAASQVAQYQNGIAGVNLSIPALPVGAGPATVPLPAGGLTLAAGIAATEPTAAAAGGAAQGQPEMDALNERLFNPLQAHLTLLQQQLARVTAPAATTTTTTPAANQQSNAPAAKAGYTEKSPSQDMSVIAGNATVNDWTMGGKYVDFSKLGTTDYSKSGFALTWNVAACLYLLTLDAFKLGIQLEVIGDFGSRVFDKLGPSNSLDFSAGTSIKLGLVGEWVF